MTAGVPSGIDRAWQNVHHRRQPQPRNRASILTKRVCFAAIDKSAVAESHGTEVSHAAPRRVMVNDRVLDFWRYPHAAAGAMLLEVHFVQRPHISGRISH